MTADFWHFIVATCHTYPHGCVTLALPGHSFPTRPYTFTNIVGVCYHLPPSCRRAGTDDLAYAFTSPHHAFPILLPVYTHVGCHGTCGWFYRLILLYFVSFLLLVVVGRVWLPCPHRMCSPYLALHYLLHLHFLFAPTTAFYFPLTGSVVFTPLFTYPTHPDGRLGLIVTLPPFPTLGLLLLPAIASPPVHFLCLYYHTYLHSSLWDDLQLLLHLHFAVCAFLLRALPCLTWMLLLNLDWGRTGTVWLPL